MTTTSMIPLKKTQHEDSATTHPTHPHYSNPRIPFPFSRLLELSLGNLRFRFQYSRISFNFSISILIFGQVV